MQFLKEKIEDLVAGVVTAAIGVFIIYEASNYRLGTLNQMGPGYFPIIIGSTMLVLALIMILTAKPGTAPQPIDLDQLRGIAFLATGFLAFAYTVEALGMMVSVFLAVFLSALGNRNTPIIHATLLAICTCVVATLVFRVGLGLQIRAF